MVVAVDGPAGVGKSTLAKHLAERWNLLYLNTGRYYRALTLLALEAGQLPAEPPLGAAAEVLVTLAESVNWDYRDGAVVADGRTLGDELHSAAVDRWVATVSELPRVRDALNAFFRRLAVARDVVCEGRDMTSAVFPHAEVRIFLDADPEVRARRRFDERPEGMSYKAVLEAIRTRDAIDRNKPVGALRITDGTVLVDSSGLTIQAVCEKVDSIVQKHRH